MCLPSRISSTFFYSKMHSTVQKGDTNYEFIKLIILLFYRVLYAIFHSVQSSQVAEMGVFVWRQVFHQFVHVAWAIRAFIVSSFKSRLTYGYHWWIDYSIDFILSGETDLNECDSSPCQNNGECVDLIGRYQCRCSGTGFEGVNCKIESIRLRDTIY